MKTLWVRQTAAVIRLEMSKTFLSRRGLWVYLLAGLPPAIYGFQTWLVWTHRLLPDFARDTNIFATVFQFLVLHLVLFFGCLGIFVNLFRSEVLDRSLHFYFLSPIRREIILTGKYLAGLLAAMVIFTSGTLLSWILLYMHYPWSAVNVYLRDGNGWSHLLAYLGVTALACVGYGSLFLLAGTVFKNPVHAAGCVLVWESINVFLPAFLQKFSVIYYLKSLCPIDAPPDVPPPFSMLIVNIDPVSPPVAVAGALAFTALVLFVAARRVRRMEISYGVD